MTSNDLTQANHIAPLSIKRRCRQMWRSMQLRSLKRRPTPREIVYFTTSKCSAKCSHCFLWRDLNADKDIMTLEQIDAFASSLSKTYSIGITGGEPFLRKDLLEVVKIFHNRANIPVINMPTHGGEPDLVHDTCEAILNSCRLHTLFIMISLLGFEDVHDKIRGVPGKFKNTIRTLEGLIQLRESNPALVVCVLVVITRDNYDEVEELLKFLHNFNISISITFIRGNYSTFNLPRSIDDCHTPQNENDQILSPEEMEAMYNKLCVLDDSYDQRLIGLSQREHLRVSIDIVRNKQQILPCYAGYINCTIYPNGDVAFCEQVKPFGNLRETGYDLGKLWHSNSANDMRNQIKECSCIHACTLNTAIATKHWLESN